MPGKGSPIARRRVALTIITIAALAVSHAPAAAGAATSDAAATQLVLSSADLATIGLRPARVRASTAASRLGRALTSARELSAVAGSAGTGRGKRLEVDAFVLRSDRDASRILTAWRRAHRAGRLKLADGGAEFVAGSRERRTAEVLLRAHDRLGLVVLTLTRRAHTAGPTAVSYAQLALARLSAKLPTTAWGKLLAQVSPSGSVSETTALEAVALSYGPLPGSIRRPAGAPAFRRGCRQPRGRSATCRS